jgi:3-isopropylmalate dehydrogenase
MLPTVSAAEPCPRIVALPGDGIGPEVTSAALEVLARLGDFTVEAHPIGGASIDEHGTALTEETLAACGSADAVLLGGVGGPKWDSTDPAAPRPEQGLLGLRKGLELYANLRPVRPSPALLDASPLKRERIEGTDLVVVRELTGGIYFGERGRTGGGAAFDTCTYSVPEIERIAEVAFRSARRRVTSVDKANVLETSRLWRETVERYAGDRRRAARGEAADPREDDVELEHMLVDNAAMQLVSRPRDFDVILTENLFGDILSDEAAMLTGSIGMLPSASLGARGAPGLFEPVHGSAPDIAGEGRANPLAMIGSVALMLRLGLGRPAEADSVERAIDGALDDGWRTPDLGGEATTQEATAAVLDRLPPPPVSSGARP